MKALVGTLALLMAGCVDEPRLGDDGPWWRVGAVALLPWVVLCAVGVR